MNGRAWLRLAFAAFAVGPVADAVSIGNDISGSLNSILKSVGGTVGNAASLTRFGVGVNLDAATVVGGFAAYDSLGNAEYVKNNGGAIAYYYYDNTTGQNPQFWAQYTSLQQVMDFAEVRELSEMQFTGGDPYVERAIDAALRSAPDPSFTAAGGAVTTLQVPAMTTLTGDIQIAKDYEFYEANKSVINALIEANPTSDFSAGWIAELARNGFIGAAAERPGNDNAERLAA